MQGVGFWVWGLKNLGLEFRVRVLGLGLRVRVSWLHSGFYLGSTTGATRFLQRSYQWVGFGYFGFGFGGVSLSPGSA